MISRFQGENGKRLLIEAIRSQRLISGDLSIAQIFAESCQLESVDKGTAIITQNDYTNDIFFIISGSFSVEVNGREVAKRHAGEHVGEMGAIAPAQRRAASVIAQELSIIVKVTESDFNTVAMEYPLLYKSLAQELSKRLLQRNLLIKPTNNKIRVFIISSAEALPVARLIQDGLQHDYDLLDVILWSEGVFKVTNYTLQTLEDEVDQADFAVAIAYGDDITQSRQNEWPVPRDNVIFELGLFMGKLGRNRAVLMEPREDKLKLPSDLAGITTIGYRYSEGPNQESRIAPAINTLRKHIISLGPQ